MTKKHTFGTTAKAIAKDPGLSVIRVAKGFRANQGFLLAGAVAYYTLLSLVPLTILVLIRLSNFVEEAELLRTTNRYLELIVPGQSDAAPRKTLHAYRGTSEGRHRVSHFAAAHVQHDFFAVTQIFVFVVVDVVSNQGFGTHYLGFGSIAMVPFVNTIGIAIFVAHVHLL
jgi:uncharacterized BrkB/YihY/UPF0761 family membrane protein